MIRLHIIVEGQTEEAFVKRVLRDHLGLFKVIADVCKQEEAFRIEDAKEEDEEIRKEDVFLNDENYISTEEDL